MSRASDAAIAAAEAGRSALAAQLAGDAADARDVDAISLLGHWHLAGEIVPRDLTTARTLLARAAVRGQAGAAFTHIALTANGAGAPPDWPRAMQLLDDLAATGNAEAQRQCALLSRMAIDDDGMPVRLLPRETLSSGPTVSRWRALVTPAECAEIAMAGRDLLVPSPVADPLTGRAMTHPIRTSSAAIIGPTRETLPLQAILRRIAAITETTVGQGEALTVLHYAPGQQYRAHVDTLPHEPNQRVSTLILYLNEGYEGGETHFPANGLTIAGRIGDAICFDNVFTNEEPDPSSRHVGQPVRRGAKWIATRWIRARSYDPWTAHMLR